MRKVPILFIAILVVGCSGAGGGSAVVPDTSPDQTPALEASNWDIYDGPYRLWGEWTWYIPDTHDRVDVVPRRAGRFHLNALKFLEEYCTNCLEITNIKSNGDSTVDITVRIRHPFQGLPEYTGFDVKGIIMFDGSWEEEGYQYYPPWPEPFRVSWRGLGDPQVLNADGYSLRWSPSYDSGQPEPIFNYYEGKYAIGTPTANLNAYLNFYTHEPRHMFSSSGFVTRTYHIWLPPGEPLVVGYAVEACWEPPLVTPVIDPLNDFPSTANQPEAYEFYFDLNNGEPITDPDCCGKKYDPSKAYMFSRQWGGHTATGFAFYAYADYSNGYFWDACGDEWPDQYCSGNFDADHFPDGDYIGVAINKKGLYSPPWSLEVAYTIFEFTIDF